MEVNNLGHKPIWSLIDPVQVSKLLNNQHFFLFMSYHMSTRLFDNVGQYPTCQPFVFSVAEYRSWKVIKFIIIVIIIIIIIITITT